MKKGIHPEYKPATIVCSCGNQVETRSTQEEIHVEICAVCHPFYTGRQKLVDTAGRVERFKRKYGETSSGASDEEIEEMAEEQAATVGAETEAEGDGEEDAEEGRTLAARAEEEKEPPAGVRGDEREEDEGEAPGSADA